MKEDKKISVLDGLTIEQISVTFDGYTFDFCFFDIKLVFGLYMAKRARDGDRLAQELLDAFNVRIIDVDGRSYWPPESGAKENEDVE